MPDTAPSRTDRLREVVTLRASITTWEASAASIDTHLSNAQQQLATHLIKLRFPPADNITVAVTNVYAGHGQTVTAYDVQEIRCGTVTLGDPGAHDVWQNWDEVVRLVAHLATRDNLVPSDYKVHCYRLVDWALVDISEPDTLV
jgi:hypothetical protein